MLIAFPTVEQELLKLQKDIMNDHTVERIILGNDAANSDDPLKRGSIIAANVYNGAFFSSGGEAVICGSNQNDGEVECNSKDYSLSLAERVVITATGATTPQIQISSTDSEKILTNDAGVQIPTVGDLVDHITDPIYGIPDEYKFDYTPLVGTIIGGIMVAIVLSMCIDISIRTFKLIILFAIAPIPIMSYVDPKASKDGAFSKWGKMLLSVWAEIFIKLAIISFMCLIMQKISGGDMGITGGFWVKIALIIGLLFFAKEAPKFICDAIGIKMPENSSLFGGLGKIAGAGALGLGAIGAGISGFSASRMADETNNRGHGVLNTMKNVGAGLFGLGSGFATGAAAGLGAKDHNGRAVMDALQKRNQLALSRGSGGSTFLGRTIAGAQMLATGEDAYGRQQRAISRLDAKATAGEKLQNYLEDRGVKKGSGYTISGKRDDGTVFNTTLDEFYKKLNEAKQKGEATFKLANGEEFETYGNEVGRLEGDLKVAAGQAWAQDRSDKGGYNDTTLQTYQKAYVDSGGTADVTNADKVKADWRAAQAESFGIKNQDDYARNKANSRNGGAS